MRNQQRTVHYYYSFTRKQGYSLGHDLVTLMEACLQFSTAVEAITCCQKVLRCFPEASNVPIALSAASAAHLRIDSRKGAAKPVY